MASKIRILTPNQLTFMLFSFFMGPEFFHLANSTEMAGQDAWISVLIALLYPVYILFTSNYIISKSPDSNIFDLNKNYFGKLAGTLLNIIFLFQFALFSSTVTSQYAKILEVNLIGFLPYNKIIMFSFIIAIYTASKGIKTLAKTNQFFSYFFLLAIVLSLIATKYISPYNLLPVFDSGIKNIATGTIQSLYVFIGFESILFIHPYAKDRAKIKSSSFKAFGLCSIIWMWTVIVSILYLGPDLLPKTHSAFLFVLGSINISQVYSFRYVFIIIWAVVCLKMIATYIFLSTDMLSSIIKIKFKNLCIIVTLFAFFLCSIFSDEALRDTVIKVVSPFYVLFNIILITILALFTSRKKKTPSREPKLHC